MTDRRFLPEETNLEQDQRLLVLFEQCGHFIYHSRGGNSGKRKILSILNMKDSIPQKKLQAILRIQSGTISESINKLVAEGLVERYTDENDKRQRMIRITEAGAAEIAELNKGELESGYFDSLTLQECVVLENIMTKLANEWNQRKKSRPSYERIHAED